MNALIASPILLASPPRCALKESISMSSSTTSSSSNSIIRTLLPSALAARFRYLSALRTSGFTPAPS